MSPIGIRCPSAGRRDHRRSDDSGAGKLDARGEATATPPRSDARIHIERGSREVDANVDEAWTAVQVTRAESEADDDDRLQGRKAINTIKVPTRSANWRNSYRNHGSTGHQPRLWLPPP
jgi:hypothetical protein